MTEMQLIVSMSPYLLVVSVSAVLMHSLSSKMTVGRWIGDAGDKRMFRPAASIMMMTEWHLYGYVVECQKDRNER